jgi:ABC-type uncharacterized transport system permease subunit
MPRFGHELAIVLYLAAALHGWGARGGVRPSRAVVWGIGLGAVVHALGFWGFHRLDPPLPIESLPSVLSLAGWLVVIAYLGALRVTNVQVGGAWVAALAAGFTLAADLALWRGHPGSAEPDEPFAWAHAHVLLSMAGFSLLALASLAGLGFLAKERQLKRKRPPTLQLPSLESLDRAGHLTLGLGFAFLTLGVISGFAWGLARGEDSWTRHSIVLLVAWVTYLRPIGMRVFRGQHGPRPARAVVLGFVVLALAYLGLRLAGGGV